LAQVFGLWGKPAFSGGNFSNRCSFRSEEGLLKTPL